MNKRGIIMIKIIKKKFVIFTVVAALLMAPVTTCVNAAELGTDTTLKILSALEIMNGDNNGNLNLTKPVTRAEFTKMVISASIYKSSSASSYAAAPYPDVPSNHWASGYVNTAKTLGLISGYLDGTFRPNATVKLEEAVTVLLKLLGYSSSDFTEVYPESQISLYKALKMDKNITANVGSNLTRLDCANLVYNTLISRTKSGTVYANSLGCPLQADGNVDYLELVNKLLDTPVVYTSGNVSDLVGFTPKYVYKNDKAATISDISEYDVIYPLDELKTVWVYNSKITGKVESVNPSKAAPTSVVVNGKEYTLESPDAKLAFSNIGEYSVGDYATLLIGRTDDSVAGVSSSASVNNTIYGMVSKIGSKNYTDSNGNSYSSDYLTVISTDGNTYEYAYNKKNISAGALVKVSFENSEFSIERLNKSKSLSGKVNSAATMLGNYKFAEDANILDVCEKSAVSIEPSRLANVRISSDDVLFYQLNVDGEICELILDDVTGDNYSYAILTGIIEASTSYVSQSKYNYICEGKDGVIASTYVFNLKSEPFKFLFVDNTINTAKNLTKVSLNSVNSTVAKSSSKSYTMADNAQIYTKDDTGYHLVSAEYINKLDAESYTLNGYFDKDETSGGRIRIVIATLKK